MASLSYRAKLGVLVGMAVLVVAALLLWPPIPQDETYHGFADDRTYLGVPNFGNLVSNVGFLVVGAFGLAFFLGKRGRRLFDSPEESWPYVIFFAGVALVSVGSTYYHAEPTTETLFWDRLLMTVAFMALFSAFIVDRVHRRIGLAVMLPLLLAVGVGSVVYWDWTESLNRGDLRPYAFVQFYPMLAIPLI